MRKMKDSGIEWIGEIPEGWEVRRGKTILNLRKQLPLITDDVITCFRDGQVTLRKNRREEGFTFSDKEIGYQHIQKGDIVIHGMDGFAGAMGISDSDGKGSPVLIVCQSNQNYHFTIYYLRMLATQNVFLALATGIRERSCDLRWNKIADLLFPLPPLPEQQRIADYLDAKCGEIDSAIEKLMQIIEKLQEYKRSLITQVITKGLNPKAKMKDSGIDWIGEIPEGWELNKINRLFYSIGSGTTPKDEEDFIGDIHWIQSGDINGGILDCSEKKVNQNTINKYTALKIFKAPYIIVAMYGASVGNVSISTINGCVNQACCVLSNPVQVLQYSFYAILALKPYLIWKAIGGGQPNISQAVVKQLRIPNPPLSEQQQIADYLDDKCSKIDAVIAKKQTLIEKLTEYKKSLIYEVVTGKREI